MRSLAYVLLILGLLGLDMVSDLFIQGAGDQHSWDTTATLGAIVAVVLLVLDRRDS